MRRALIRAVLALLAVVIGLAVVPFSLAGTADGIVLLYYVLGAAAIALVLLTTGLRRLLPRALPTGAAAANNREAATQVDQLERIRRALDASAWSEAQLHDSLRPIVREVVAERLAHKHGIDLDRSPERARAAMGEGRGRAWDLARPDRPPPIDSRGGGWAPEEIEELLDELEAL